MRTRGGAVRTPVVASSRQFNLKNSDTEVRSHGKEPLGDDGVVSAPQKMIKQRIESAELYDEGGRAELAGWLGTSLPLIVIIPPACRRKDEEVKAAIAEAARTPAPPA